MSKKDKKSLAEVGEVFGVDMPMLLTRIIVAIVLVVGAYSIWFNLIVDTTLGGPEAWGQFGDYFGGMLNPVLSALALVILAVSLNANVKALQQNEKILELTRAELENTTKQIEQNNSALAEQIQVVQASATLERLARQAEILHKKIEWFFPDPTDKHNERLRSIKILITSRENIVLAFQNTQIWSAFDPLSPTFERVAERSELDKDQITSFLTQGKLGEMITLLKLLNRMCRRAILIQETANMDFSEYYQQMVGRQCLGLVVKGYVRDDDLECLTLTPDSFTLETSVASS